MADALISVLLEQLASVVYEHTKEAVTLVLNAEKDVESFSSKLKDIQAVLEDAEKKQVTDARVERWLEKLKNVSYGMDDVLDEWNTEILRRQMEEGENAKKKVMSTFGNLKSLQALDFFPVCDHGDDVEDEEALKLGDLGIMDQLQGRLMIERLGNAIDASEVEKAQLGNKKHLSDLGLRFQQGNEEQRKSDEEILKALQPHQNLESFSIWNCHCTTWPLYQNLRRVVLGGWKFCEVLPPLGKLPSLEILYIWSMNNVKNVGVEFLGIEEEIETFSAGILFPKLKDLLISRMTNWEEWKGIIKDSSSEITIMPRLSSLRIVECRKLKGLPDFVHKITALRTLEIRECAILEGDYEKGVGKEWPNISHIPNITIKSDW